MTGLRTPANSLTTDPEFRLIYGLENTHSLSTLEQEFQFYDAECGHRTLDRKTPDAVYFMELEASETPPVSVQWDSARNACPLSVWLLVSHLQIN